MAFSGVSSQNSIDIECDYTGTSNTTPEEWFCDSAFSHSTDPAYLATFSPIVLNIHFWRIVQDNGNAGLGHITENDALRAISEINRELNQYGIFIKYRGFKDIPNSAMYEPLNPFYLSGLLNSYNGPLEIEKSDAINMYVPYDYIQAYAGSATLFGTRSQVRSGVFEKWGILHELGHNLGLLHTFQHFQGVSFESCEHVTRDVNNILYNADTNGDRVTDTAATLVLQGYNTNEQTCEYEGTDEDCLDFAYDIYDTDVQNFMNYVPQDELSCEKTFTLGQGIRMREALAADCINRYASVISTIASLYEPYEGEYYLAGPTDPATQTPYFQPGFDYKFVECCCDYPQPADYNDISYSFNQNNVVKQIADDETNYTTIYHPNHTAIFIEEVELSLGYSYPRKCYDNYNRKPNSGTIIKFNDGVFNTNVTITPQDSTAINNPNLINNLQQGLYKIEKNHVDGAVEETVIIKENE